MKRSLSFLLLLVIFMVGCFKDDSKQLNNSINSSKGEQGYLSSVNCKGNCENDGCYARFLIQNGTLTCLPCTDCKMHISYLQEKEDNYQYRTELSSVLSILVKTIENQHGKTDPRILELVMDHAREQEFFKLSYSFEEDPLQEYSMAYLVDFSKNLRSDVGGIVVDCSGDCGAGSNDLCTEVFNTRNGEVYCKCQSDNCVMRITQQ